MNLPWSRPNRRVFLKWAAVGGAAAFGALVDDSDRDARAVNAADGPPPGLPKEVIDTHTHFYDPTRPEGIPWPGKGDALLYRPTLPSHFREVAAPHGVTGTVVVEASPWVEDNQWLLDLAEKDKFVVGVVGNLDPADAKFAERLQRFAKHRRWCGFRINGGALDKALDQPEFVAALKKIVDHDRQLDINGGPLMLPGIARLAKTLPELRIVINHVANVRNDGKAVDAEWLKGMRACAEGKHVFCKVSALAEGASQKDAKGVASTNADYYKPLLDAVWNTWGDDRVIFGSNWPVCARAASYHDLLTVVAQYAVARGNAAKFFAGNAKAAYRWDRT